MESPRPAHVKLVWVWPITFKYGTTKFKRACVLIPIKENKLQINRICWTIQTSNEGLSGGGGGGGEEKGWSHWISMRKLPTETTRFSCRKQRRQRWDTKHTACIIVAAKIYIPGSSICSWFFSNTDGSPGGEKRFLWFSFVNSRDDFAFQSRSNTEVIPCHDLELAACARRYNR